jgi:hypothetical protein
MKLAISCAKDAHYARKGVISSGMRDLGVIEASAGKMRAQVTSAKSAMDRATGWHYHTCDMQFVYSSGGGSILNLRVAAKTGSVSATAL